jgi:hypothetical protein
MLALIIQRGRAPRGQKGEEPGVDVFSPWETEAPSRDRNCNVLLIDEVHTDELYVPA